MTGQSGDSKDNDLFLVDSGVESLASIYLNLPNLRTLNLHSNYITRYASELFCLAIHEINWFVVVNVVRIIFRHCSEIRC